MGGEKEKRKREENICDFCLYYFISYYFVLLYFILFDASSLNSLLFNRCMLSCASHLLRAMSHPMPHA